MSETLTKLVIDCSTGTESVIALTPEEISEREMLHAAQEALHAEREAELQAINAIKESAKTKLIAGQPLTEEEASLLII